MRAYLKTGARIGADPTKGIQRIFDLSLLDEPPFRLPLGKDAVGAIKAEIKRIGDDVAKYEGWSEGLAFDA